MRVLSSLFLALTVALSSVTMAQARHHSRAAAMIDLCLATGVISLAVDAQGNPVGPELPCPDCVPALLALAVSGAPDVAAPWVLLAPPVTPSATLAAIPARPAFRFARAPPAQA
jgi:hypothetical protein